MTGASALGGWPGTDPLEAAGVVLGDLADAPEGVQGLPFVPSLRDRGPAAGRLGRALSLLDGLAGELGPHGWKLADRPGRDHARAQALARADLDALAVAAHGYAGPLVVPVLGPLTLAARLWLARGDRVLADPGAVREVTSALGAGLAEHLAALTRAVPGTQPTVLLLEPLLAAAVAGTVPTFSGHGRLRRVAGPVAGEHLAAVVADARGGGAQQVVVHVGAAASVLVVAAAGRPDGLGVQVDGLDERGWETVATAVESGRALWAQVPPQATSQCAGPDVVGQADTVRRPWRRLGLPVAGLADVVLLGGDAPGSSSADEARAALAGVVRAARVLADTAAG